MSWLRLDDGFTQHPKLAGWTPAQKWAWLEVLSYCARYQTGGRIPEDLNLLPRSVTPQLLKKAENARLIDRGDDGALIVHDWPIYNAPTVAEKVAHYLAQHPDATANDVHRVIGGTRQVVLSEVDRQRASGSDPGSTSGSAEPLTEPPDVSQSGSKGGSESGSHARGPVPSRPRRTPPTPPSQGGNGHRPHKLTRRELARYTGCRQVRGTHGTGHVYDPLGTDKPPPDWKHGYPSRDEVEAALAAQADPLPGEPD